MTEDKLSHYCGLMGCVEAEDTESSGSEKIETEKLDLHRCCSSASDSSLQRMPEKLNCLDIKSDKPPLVQLCYDGLEQLQHR